MAGACLGVDKEWTVRKVGSGRQTRREIKSGQ